MAITDNVRKAFSGGTPFYAAAGTVDLAAKKLREVPPLIEKLRAEAPERLDRMRNTDPKMVQERVARQAKDVRVLLTEMLGGMEADLKKLRENAQEFATHQMNRAEQYAHRAGDAYDDLAERGRGAVRTWRGETAETVGEVAAGIEPPRQTGGARRTSGERPAGQKNGSGQSTSGRGGQGSAKSGGTRKPSQGR